MGSVTNATKHFEVCNENIRFYSTKKTLLMKKTLVIGASENPARYSYKAIIKLQQHAHPVVAIGLREGAVNGLNFGKEKTIFEDIHTITLYINPTIQEQYYDYILSLKPQRVIFNPGTENEAFERLLQYNKIETLQACTLVMLATGQY